MTQYNDQCKRCGAGEPLRSIKMWSGERELLCESCFKDALDEGEVHPADPRLPPTEAKMSETECYRCGVTIDIQQHEWWEWRWEENPSRENVEEVIAQWAAFSGHDTIGHFRIVRFDGRTVVETRIPDSEQWQPERVDFQVVPGQTSDIEDTENDR